ncbi:MAG: hypothetical protein ACYC3L_13435 [Gemmatimonadaceae bacterium]
MIHIDNDDVVGVAHDLTGRFVVFHKTDLPSGFPMPWWAACLDTGGDGVGILVRPTVAGAGDGWTAAELLHVAVSRAFAEVNARKRRAACAGFLSLALRAHGDKADFASVTFSRGADRTSLPWLVASVRGHDLVFSADAEGKAEGITLDQMLVVLDRLHRDWRNAPPAARRYIVSAARDCACGRHEPGDES